MSGPFAVVIAPKMGGSDMMPVPETFRTALNDQAQGIYGDLTAGQSLSESGYDWFCRLAGGAIAEGYMRHP